MAKRRARQANELTVRKEKGLAGFLRPFDR